MKIKSKHGNKIKRCWAVPPGDIEKLKEIREKRMNDEHISVSLQSLVSAAINFYYESEMKKHVTKILPSCRGKDG